MSGELVVPNEQEVTLCYLEHEREQWLPWHEIDVRAGGNNGEAKTKAAYFMARIDKLLEELVIVA
jgi:hypothetical protein